MMKRRGRQRPTEADGDCITVHTVPLPSPRAPRGIDIGNGVWVVGAFAFVAAGVSSYPLQDSQT
jgi:hypothetical protein